MIHSYRHKSINLISCLGTGGKFSSFRIPFKLSVVAKIVCYENIASLLYFSFDRSIFFENMIDIHQHAAKKAESIVASI